MTTSKQELFVREKIKEMFPKYTLLLNWRPKSLMNPKTGKNLEFDIYIGKFKCAIEYQGAIHFRDIKRYNNNSDKSREYDILKLELIRESKPEYSVIEIFETDIRGDFTKNFLKRIQNNIDLCLKNLDFEQYLNLVKMKFYIESGQAEFYNKTKKLEKLIKAKKVFCYNKGKIFDEYLKQNNLIEYKPLFISPDSILSKQIIDGGNL